MNESSACKKQLRAEFLEKRALLPPEERAAHTAAIVDRIAALPAFRQARTVLVYHHIRSELCLDALPAHPASAGKRFAFPLCCDGFELKALIPGQWKTGPFCIPEPDPDSSPELSPEELDLVICPGAAFDPDGHRLGMGAGYYDRFLPKCKNAVVMMAAFEIQKSSRIPFDEWDYPMDMIVTEDKIYKPGGF